MKIQDKNMIDWGLLAAYVSDNLNPEQKKEIETWLAESEENKKILSQAQKVWEKATVMIDEQLESTLAWNKVCAKAGIESTASTKVRYFNVNFVLRIAAIIVVVIGIVFFWQTRSHERIAQTDGEKRMQIDLPDGSTVTLNHKSTLKYFTKLSGMTREVVLTGEAFFNIAKNPSNPFIIHTGKSAIKVIGTSFDVNNFNDGQVEVVVNTGVVAFYTKGIKKAETPVTLTKDQKIIYKESTGSLIKGINDDPNYFSWKTGKFTFRQTQLSEVFEKIEDFYGIDITVDDEAIKKYRLTATFDNQPADQVMNVLRLTFGLKIEHNGRLYQIKEKDR